MYEVRILDLKTKNVFTKNYDSPYLLRKFVNKCKYSKTVQVLSVFKLY